MDSQSIHSATLNIKQSPIFPAALLLAAGLLCIAGIGREAGDFAIAGLTMMAVLSIQFDRQPFPAHSTNNHVATGLVAIVGVVTLKLVIESFGVPLATRWLPFFFLLGYWSYQHGFDALKIYWRELLLLFILGIPDRALMAPLVMPLLSAFDIPSLSHATANMATGVTYLISGWEDLDVIGTHIHAPNVIANVYQPCDGGRIMDFMIRLTIMLVVAFPVKRYKWPIILIVSVVLGWIINVLRVTAMVFIANTGDMVAYEYWHTGEGSKIFNLIAIILFCLVAYFQITPANSGKQTPATTQ